MVFDTPPTPPPSHLERINKLDILPIRQIQPLLVLQLHIPGCSADGGFLFILRHAVEVDEGHDEEAEGVADDDGDFSGDVARGVGGAECLWSWWGRLGGWLGKWGG